VHLGILHNPMCKMPVNNLEETGHSRHIVNQLKVTELIHEGKKTSTPAHIVNQYKLMNFVRVIYYSMCTHTHTHTHTIDNQLMKTSKFL
jgi:hypothetical protein